MTRDVLVISLLVLWLSLNGLEHLSNVWVDSYSRVTEDGYFATPREADEIADDTKLVASKVQPWTPWSCHQSVCIPSQSSRRQTTFLKQALKIYKLHDVFLI
jgi:hypothetical protein